MEESETKTDDDANSAERGMLQKIQKLEEENRRMQNEFNAQRAKLKELFMQKESEYARCQDQRQTLQCELDELKSQFLVADIKSQNEMQLKERKAQEEISSLQQLVQDTIEESTICKSELEQLRDEIKRLQVENHELRLEIHQQNDSTSSLGPQVLSQVKKTLARKLGGDQNASNPNYNESFEEISQLKTGVDKKYAHEDAEVLRSIVVQLQEEMQALKEKLREADEELQAKRAQAASPLIRNPSSGDDGNPSLNKATSIDQAADDIEVGLSVTEYESKIEGLQAQLEENEKKCEGLNRALLESRDQLSKESALRKDLEDQWQEKREAHKMEVQLLREQIKTNEKKLLDLQQKFLETRDNIVKQMQLLTDERESINKHLETLQADNDFLSGRYLATAEEIENQYINLPNTVEELQEFILRQQSELIQARVSSEYEKKNSVSSLDEIQILRGQLNASNNERRAYKKEVQTEIKSLQDRLTEHIISFQKCEATKNSLERKEAELNRQISELRVEIIELQESNEKLTKATVDYKSKIKNLQDDLATSEQVQKDFVKLSQNLQISLEKLRCADNEVRWQDDDDVDNCPTCNTYFTVTVRKIHCRHCGHIFCEKCLTKTVQSGPRKRLARVCDICHTLLTPNTAPYFSHEPINAS